jgi:MmyB-like transcription regulator ligand binding domain
MGGRAQRSREREGRELAERTRLFRDRVAVRHPHLWPPPHNLDLRRRKDVARTRAERAGLLSIRRATGSCKLASGSSTRERLIVSVLSESGGSRHSRVHREVAANPSDETMKGFLEGLFSYPAVPSRWRVLKLVDSPPPFLTINYSWNSSTLRLFSTLTSFGTAQDVVLQEMRIESFFFADRTTSAALIAAR